MNEESYQYIIKVQNAPKGCEESHKMLLAPEALSFLGELVITFSSDIEKMYDARRQRRSELLNNNNSLPNFLMENSPAKQDNWKVAPLPPRLLDRRIDLGDVSPANIKHLRAALEADVQGVQIDFDDGHCPLWSQQLNGLYTVIQAATGGFPGIKPLEKLPILMLRPRAWNMIEYNVTVNGKYVPGSLFDFALLIFHLGKVLLGAKSGPYFYLSKLEHASEARLWNNIFVWTQKKLEIPHGSIKACVLIENILAAFQMQEILYELRHHSLGLNCGIWDYAASIINILGHRQEFVLPDRNNYVNVKKKFLSSYMALVISTCRKHGAPATGGMAALLVPEMKSQDVINKVIASKQHEINMGLNGFLVYDIKLVPHLQNLWNTADGHHASSPAISATDLLTMPSGGVTQAGINHNIAVSILFIYYWLQGQGHFYYKGAVEDSATAEISRSQLWQWIHHKASIEESGETINRELVENLSRQFIENFVKENNNALQCSIAESFFLSMVCTKHLPDFITSHLNGNRVFHVLAAHFQTKHMLAKL